MFFNVFKDEINDDGSDKDDQRWNNSSNDEDDDAGGAEYSWRGINEKESSANQTKGIHYILCI